MGAESIEFVLPARAENVQLIRHALSGLAETVGMEPERVADLKSVVTEACMNVVVHAYEDGTGPLNVRAWRADAALTVEVRDFGAGIRPRVDLDRASLRLGLPLIAALSESFELTASPDGGTLVRMVIPFAANGNGNGRPPTPPVGEETKLSVPAGLLLGPVLSRVISMFAARADFSLDKLSDAVLLGDAISANDPDAFPGGTAQISISEDEGAFSLRIGPFEGGGGRRLVAGLRIEGTGVSLERLASEVRIEEAEGAENVVLEFSRR